MGQTIVDIDRPANGTTYALTQGFGGWAMDRTATIKSVQILIDGAFVTNAAYGGNRQDACNAIGNYPGCPNVGYNWALNTHTLSNGNHSVTVSATTSDGRTTSASNTFVVSNIGSGNSSSITGCTGGSVSACLDPIPATYLSGSWIELDGSDVPSEWTITAANNGTPGGSGSVTGFVYAFPPASATNCPVVTYTATGSFSPSVITNGVSGFTNYHWVASGPNPSGTCSGYTPVSSQTFNGTVFNKGNDTATNNWSNSSGLSGTDSIETNLILTPTGENTTDGGWGVNLTTVYDFVEGLVDTTSYDPPDPNNNKFQGRQVYESGTGDKATSFL